MEHGFYLTDYNGKIHTWKKTAMRSIPTATLRSALSRHGKKAPAAHKRVFFDRNRSCVPVFNIFGKKISERRTYGKVFGKIPKIGRGKVILTE